jgi:DNA (cytosine-5)-methyltransferase 1
MLSIFATKDEAKEWGRANGQAAPIRPLAENTMKRIARGVKRYVLDNPKPFVVTLCHGESGPNSTRWGKTDRDLGEPLTTVKCSGGDAIVAPHVVHIGNGERPGQAPRCMDLQAPLGTVVGAKKHGVVAAFLAQHNGGFYSGDGRPLSEPQGTVCSSGSLQGVVAAHIQRDFGTSVGHDMNVPMGTLTADRNGHAALVGSFLAKYYGTGEGQALTEPVHTVPTVDRFGFVTVQIQGQPFYIADIAMRMLQPRELYRAQGFRDGYVIDVGADGRKLTKTEQVRMCGNSVCPPVAAALAGANAPALVVRQSQPQRGKKVVVHAA